MDRRDFIKSSVAAGAGLALGGDRLWAGTTGAKPNVLLIMVDQMRQPKWFPPEAVLPNLEKLKTRGVEFTRHFTSAVPCSPSRACLFTGLHMDQQEIAVNVGRKWQKSLDPKIPTLGHLFRKAGCQTPYFGKWHLTRKKEISGTGLEQYGFDYQSQDSAGGPGLTVDAPYTDAACEWLGNPKNHDRPWLLTLSLLNPHDICGYFALQSDIATAPRIIKQLPGNWDDDLSGKPRCQSEFQKATMPGDWTKGNQAGWLNYLNYYYYLNTRADALVGKVLDTLEKTGKADNTLVIFTSDHGEMGGSHRLRLKGPFVYEENTNVPLIISRPGKIPAGKKSNSLCQNVDLFPTLAAMLGYDLAREFPYLPGKDLSGALSDPEHAEGSNHVLFSFHETIALKMKVQMLGRKLMTAPHSIRAVREQDRVYARYFDPASDAQEFELYDLRTDPLEMKNLAADPAFKSLREEMSEKLRLALAREAAPIDFSRMPFKP
jgi:arylsulfatase A-like enzyme